MQFKREIPQQARLHIRHYPQPRGIPQCDFNPIDENRAFLNAPKLDQIQTIARIPGDPSFYKVIYALFGLKTSIQS
jgi:hypothetical protein